MKLAAGKESPLPMKTARPRPILGNGMRARPTLGNGINAFFLSEGNNPDEDEDADPIEME